MLRAAWGLRPSHGRDEDILEMMRIVGEKKHSAHTRRTNGSEQVHTKENKSSNGETCRTMLNMSHWRKIWMMPRRFSKQAKPDCCDRTTGKKKKTRELEGQNRSSEQAGLTQTEQQRSTPYCKVTMLRAKRKGVSVHKGRTRVTGQDQSNVLEQGTSAGSGSEQEIPRTDAFAGLTANQSKH